MLCFIAVITIQCLLAQPVITGTGIIPEVGDCIEIRYLYPETMNINGSGPDDQKIWDFSGASIVETINPITVSYSDPAGTLFELSHLDANLVASQSGEFNLYYYKKTNNSLSLKGAYTTFDSKNYGSDSILTEAFPLTLGEHVLSSYSGNNFFTPYGSSDFLITNGEVDMVADQYGTLITYNGSVFNNVTRVKITFSEVQDLVTNGDTIPSGTMEQTDYVWYHENITGEILRFIEIADTAFTYCRTLIYHENNEIVDLNVNEAVQDVHLCMGVSEQGVINNLSPTMTVSDLFENEHIVYLNWSVTDFVENQTGAYDAVATFQLPEGLNQPATPIDLEIHASVYVHEPFYTEQSIEICENTGYVFNDSIISVSGTYTYFGESVYGCDSTVVMNITVESAPIQITISQIPENHFLLDGEFGQISILNSQQDINYRVVCNGLTVSENITGNGDVIILGSEFTAGYYEIWSEAENGCSYLQGSAIFNGYGISAFAVKQDSGSAFNAGEVLFKLYCEGIDEDYNSVMLYFGESFIEDNGMGFFPVPFSATCYLSSTIVDSVLATMYVANIFYDSAIIFDEATGINYSDWQHIIAGISHPLLIASQGTNTVSGTVSGLEIQKNDYNVMNLAVIMRNSDDQEIIGVSLTDESGLYKFVNVPDNSDLEFFVTNPEHPQWIPGSISTNDNQNYILNFIIDDQTVYPEVTSFIEAPEQIGFKLEVFPNPALNYIEFNALPQKGTILVFDENGNIVCMKQIGQKNTIPINDLTTGTYVVIVYNGKEIFGTAKFVKN